MFFMESKEFPIKIGFNLVINPGDPASFQVVSEQGRLVFFGEILPLESRKVRRRWIARNWVFLDNRKEFARNGKEAEDLVEKKISELWGNPYSAPTPEWLLGRT